MGPGFRGPGFGVQGFTVWGSGFRGRCVGMAVRGFGVDVSDWWFRVRPLGFVFFGVWVFRCFRLAVRGRGFELEFGVSCLGDRIFRGFKLGVRGFRGWGFRGFEWGFGVLRSRFEVFMFLGFWVSY